MSIHSYESFVKEAKQEPIKVFAANRLKGATEIAMNAKEKGGDALLTYHHFSVKLSYYQQEVEGTLDMKKSEAEFQSLLGELSATGTNTDQIVFQELVGKLEVLGELLIRYKNP